jgi:hypothetical protein
MKHLIALAFVVGVATGTLLGRHLVYREAIQEGAAIWIWPSDASPDSPSKNNWLPTLQWRPASTLKPPVIRPEDPPDLPDSGRIS